SRLSAYIKDLGIYHPEDMARFIIIAYHRNLNMKFLDIKELMNIFHEKQNKEKEELINSGEILHQQTRTREGGG
ncbi:MAG: DNA-binding transcriptional MerR regulator, partial [Saprospiraceae bacterium]